MKVVHLTTVHSAFDTRIFHKEAKTLQRAGHQVTLIAPQVKPQIIDGVKMVGLPKVRTRWERIFALAWYAFRQAIQQRAEVYHFHDPELLPVGVLLKRRTGAKVVYDVHEDVPEQMLSKDWIPSLLRRPLAWLFHRWEKWAAGRLDAVVVATEGIAQKFPAHQPIVVHNFPDLRMWPNFPRRDLQSRARMIVYAGGISRQRGAVEMVQAMEYLKFSGPVWLKLIGKFEPLELCQQLQSLPGYQRVQHLGWLAPERVYEHLREADVGLVCLHPEPRYMVAWPVKLFEYMAAGLPVVVSDFPLWRQIVEGSGCGLCVNPLRPMEIAQAVDRLLSDPAEAQRMGQHGRQAVEQKYHWDLEAKKLLHLYETLQP
ncbi:MAG: glycosyltransferase family 4 protein [Thermoguttaceae bacterium]|nr:glycosyltransferase family 4 protein [Thermoguttaceae bacterium]MDW8038418.1 glycosyltransferase family 4 protein [Thermoguttaceae bacterium]